MDRRSFLALAAAPAARAAQALAQAKPLRLKITGVKTFLVYAGGANWVFCKVYTDQGLVGLGEGSVTSKEATVAQAIQEHERFLVGKDPTDIELLWQGMYRYPRWRGGPVLNSAISAVEIALWDIVGQGLGVPVYKLLGGAARRRVRLYKDVGSTPEAFLQAREEGYTAAKSGFIRVDNDLVIPHFAVREGIRRLEEVRKAVGDDFDIAVDAHGKLTTVMAVEFCNAIEHLRPFFVEEATQLEDLGELELLRQKTKVPLATGERLFTKYGFTELCSRHLVNYIQPDVVHAGGILELKKIGAIAEAYRIEMAPHNPQSAVSTMASLHVNATTPAATILEYNPRREQWIEDLFYGQGPVVKGGYAELPERPGLGVALDEKVAARRPYQPVNRPNYVFEDGAVADH
jgi:galactonate dehydratase